LLTNFVTDNFSV